MMDLIERAPDSWQVMEAAGYPPAIMFYYGTTWDGSHTLAIGARFGVVYSPNYYVHPESPLHPWHYTVFEVSLHQFRPGRGLERSYTQVKRRQLTRFEVPHFESLWLDISLMGRAAG